MIRQNSVLRFITVGIIFSLTALACEKTTYNTKPDLTFKQARSYDVSQGDLLGFILKITDKEGDIQDSIWIRAFTRRCPNSALNIAYKMPEVPAKTNLDAEIDVNYTVGVIDPNGPPIWNLNLCPGVDTAIFQFWVRDKAGNISDTVETDKPVLIRNN